MTRSVITALTTALVVFGLASPATAGEAYEVLIEEHITDVDPCTGLEHEITQNVVFTVREKDGRTVAQGERTYSSSLGYTGRGVSSYVLNDRVERFSANDVLTDDAGHRIRVRNSFVLDLSTGEVRSDIFRVTCVGS